MNRSNRSSDQPSSDAIIAFVAWRFGVVALTVPPCSSATLILKFPQWIVLQLFSRSAADEFWRPLSVEGLDAFLEIVGLAQPAVAMPFELDRNRQRRIFSIVEELLRGALRD